MKVAKFRRRAKPYRLIVRKASRFIAWKPRGGKQESTKQVEREEARRVAYRRIAETRPDLAQELGIEVTPNLKGFHAKALSPQPSALNHGLAATHQRAA